MTDIREFMGQAPTHCTICGSRWDDGCAPPCINAPATWGPPPTEEEADALCAEDERLGGRPMSGLLNDCSDCGCAALERVGAKGTWVTCSGCCKQGLVYQTFAEAAEAWNHPCTDCDGTGVTHQTERRCACTLTDEERQSWQDIRDGMNR